MIIFELEMVLMVTIINRDGRGDHGGYFGIDFRWL